MEKKKRYYVIDFLRAISIIGIFAIHTFSYNLNSSFNQFIWNYLQFVVQILVFCSGYVIVSIYGNNLNGRNIFGWYKKRFFRLLFPYYLFLLIYYFSVYFLPHIFTGLDMGKSFLFLIKSFVFIGGPNLSWFPLLFLELTVITPFLLSISRVKRNLYLYATAAALITLWITFDRSSASYYRWIMWIPWSLVYITPLFLTEENTQRAQKFKDVLLGLIFFTLFLLLYFFNLFGKSSLNLINHKYPPDFFYLFYGYFFIFFLLFLAKQSFFENKIIKNTYVYLSKRSYSLFFIHFIVLDGVITLSRKSNFNNVFVEFIFVTFITIFLSILLDKISILRKHIIKF